MHDVDGEEPASPARLDVLVIGGRRATFAAALGGEYRVSVAEHDGLQLALREREPAIVVVDLAGPRGQEAALLRDLEGVPPRILIVAIADDLAEAVRRRCHALGACVVEGRPIGPGRVAAEVRRLARTACPGVVRVAVVEDDADISCLIAAVLRDRGYEVELFGDGARALLEIPQGAFAAVVTDLQMPRLDGMSLCRALRASFTKEALPIIMLSARNQERDIIRALEAGANDYLVKPFVPAMLLVKLRLLAPPSPTERGRKPVLDLAQVAAPRRIGDYELQSELGQGGAAIVYRALRVSTGEAVALKVLRANVTDADDVARYFREVAALSLVESPYVVRVVDYGDDDGHRYLAMALLSGASASEELRRGGPLRASAALSLALHVCEALLALRGLGLVHRDVKPANIILREDGVATLIDLGLAKRVKDKSMTSTTTLIGTLAYTAPEAIARGAPETTETDLYSLGVSLYELLSGRLPFDGPTEFETAEAIVRGQAPPLRDLRPELPSAVAGLVASLMALDPAARPSLLATRDALAALLRTTAGRA